MGFDEPHPSPERSSPTHQYVRTFKVSMAIVYKPLVVIE
jgi:hypothetical protein